MNTLRAVLLLLVAVTACAPPPGSADSCAVEKLAELPVTMVSGLPRVTVAVNGRPADLLLDTGATILVLTEPAARRLAVDEDIETRYTQVAVGGFSMSRGLLVDRLGLGATELADQRAVQLGFGLDGFGSPPPDGILGNSVLHRYDVEIDFPAGRMTLYRPRFCPGGPIPWQGAYTTIRRPPSPLNQRYHIMPVRLDGQDLVAMIDTGSTATIVDTAVAHRLGVDPDSLTAARGIPVQGVAQTKGTLWRHRFDSLEIAGRRYQRPELAIVALGTTADMLIGQNFLRGRRLWLSFGSDTVYVSAP